MIIRQDDETILSSSQEECSFVESVDSLRIAIGKTFLKKVKQLAEIYNINQQLEIIITIEYLNKKLKD